MTELFVIDYVLGFIIYLVDVLRRLEERVTLEDIYLSIIEALYWPIMIVLRLFLEN